MTDHGTEQSARPAPVGVPRSVAFGDLPRQPLQEGTGTLRQIRAETRPGLDLRWQLQLVELKGPGGAFQAPEDTHQRIVGLSGPQVAVGAPDRTIALRRDSALLVRSSAVAFQRPRLRVTGASTLLVLTFAALAVAPALTFRTLVEGSATLPAGTHVLIALQGDLRVDGVRADRNAALLLDPRATHTVRTTGARVLTLSDPVIAAERLTS